MIMALWRFVANASQCIMQLEFWTALAVKPYPAVYVYVVLFRDSNFCQSPVIAVIIHHRTNAAYLMW